MADEEGEDENLTYYGMCSSRYFLPLSLHPFFMSSQQATETGSAGKLPCLDGDREWLT